MGIDIEKTALSRIPETLSKGENFEKLLKLHVSSYVEQSKDSEVLKNLKNIDKASSYQLEWFGVLKGLKRPNMTIDDIENQFFNVFTPDNVGFGEFDISQPLYFGQRNYSKLGDPAFRIMLKAYCELTEFTGTIDEYSYFFKEIFGLDIQIRFIDGILLFIIEDTNKLKLDIDLIKDLTPALSQTKNKFHNSPYRLFSLAFDNIEGTNLDFGEELTSSLYFDF